MHLKAISIRLSVVISYYKYCNIIVVSEKLLWGGNNKVCMYVCVYVCTMKRLDFPNMVGVLSDPKKYVF